MKNDYRLVDAIYNILIQVCGAYDNYEALSSFRFHMLRQLQTHQNAEYRFGGKLGFGGKLYFNGNRWYVNCYQEDQTPERLLIIKEANEQIQRLINQQEQDGTSNRISL